MGEIRPPEQQPVAVDGSRFLRHLPRGKRHGCDRPELEGSVVR